MFSECLFAVACSAGKVENKVTFHLLRFFLGECYLLYAWSGEAGIGTVVVGGMFVVGLLTGGLVGAGTSFFGSVVGGAKRNLS